MATKIILGITVNYGINVFQGSFLEKKTNFLTITVLKYYQSQESIINKSIYFSLRKFVKDVFSLF